MSSDFSSIAINKSWLEQQSYYQKIESSGVLDDEILSYDEIENCGLNEDERAQLLDKFQDELDMLNSAIDEESQKALEVNKTYWPNGNVHKAQTMDSNGNLAKIETFDQGGKLTFAEEYSSDGNLTKRSYYNESGKETTIVTYNPDGSCVVKQLSETTGEYSTFYYNANGEETDANGNVIKKTPSSESSSESSGSLETSETSFDYTTGYSGDVISDSEAESYAMRLHNAMDGNGTDEQEVKEVMQSLQGADLAKVAIVYETLYGQTLIDAIKGDFSCGLENTYVSQIEGAMKLSQKDSNATISEVEIDNYIHMLNKAMKGAGTNENTVSDIINSLSPKNLKLVMEAYKKEYGTSLRKHINDDFSGDAQQLLFAKLDKAAEYEEESEKDENKIISDSKAQYYAESLNTAMKGWGTDEEAIATIMKKLKGEDLKKVLDVYEDIYGTSLKNT